MLTRLLLVVATTLGLTACGGGPAEVRMPEGVTVHIDQSRVLQKTRTVFLRLHNGSDQDLRVTRFVLSSPRFDDVVWTGDERVEAPYDADLELEMPRGRCGTGVDATVTLTYAVDGEERRSSLRPDDPYGAAARFLDRDCAERTLDEAADVELGDVTVVGEGGDSRLRLPVTITPTGERDDVVLRGFGDTVLFAQAEGSAVEIDRPVSGDPFTVDMVLRPARCDAHVLAEDKVGTLIPVEIAADGLPDGTSFYLPIGEARRSAFYDYYDQNCRLAGRGTYP